MPRKRGSQLPANEEGSCAAVAGSPPANFRHTAALSTSFYAHSAFLSGTTAHASVGKTQPNRKIAVQSSTNSTLRPATQSVNPYNMNRDDVAAGVDARAVARPAGPPAAEHDEDEEVRASLYASADRASMMYRLADVRLGCGVDWGGGIQATVQDCVCACLTVFAHTHPPYSPALSTKRSGRPFRRAVAPTLCCSASMQRSLSSSRSTTTSQASHMQQEVQQQCQQQRSTTNRQCSYMHHQMGISRQAS